MKDSLKTCFPFPLFAFYCFPYRGLASRPAQDLYFILFYFISFILFYFILFLILFYFISSDFIFISISTLFNSYSVYLYFILSHLGLLLSESCILLFLFAFDPYFIYVYPRHKNTRHNNSHNLRNEDYFSTT